MGISIGHILLVLIIVFVLFGAGKLPQVMAELAKGLKAFKKGIDDEIPDIEKKVHHRMDTIHHKAKESASAVVKTVKDSGKKTLDDVKQGVHEAHKKTKNLGKTPKKSGSSASTTPQHSKTTADKKTAPKKPVVKNSKPKGAPSKTPKP